MYKLKIRNVGEMIIKDERLGQNLLTRFQNSELPKVVDINGKSFLSRLIESIDLEEGSNRQIYEYHDTELVHQAKLFNEKLQEAKKIKELDYSKNEVYPYHSNLLLHVFYVSNVISNNNEELVYRISVNKTSNGEDCISNFLNVNNQFLCLLELLSRYPEKYTKYCRQFYK